jgi:hypothetical protein
MRHKNDREEFYRQRGIEQKKSKNKKVLIERAARAKKQQLSTA